MVHHQRKQDSGELCSMLRFVRSGHGFIRYRKGKKRMLLRLFLISIFAFGFILAAFFLSRSNSLNLEKEAQEPHKNEAPCSSLCCDRTSLRSDVCFMKGDVRTNSVSKSLFLVSSSVDKTVPAEEERIRPYTRKWENNTMQTIDELRLRPTNITSSCDVRHDVPAVFFSTGGYTGNVYHEFNDGIIPLYITSQQFNRKVVFVILEYHDWWITKYDNILSHLSDFPPIDFTNDKRTHCFPEAIVGLKIHDELAIDPTRMTHNRTIQDFRQMLDEAYRPRIEYIERVEEGPKLPVLRLSDSNRPKLLIVSRNGSRGIENEAELVKLADEVGFAVEVLRPGRTTELAKIYRAMNASDVMIGVHGAAMTHLLFMRPGSVFIQIVPLGTDWAAETYYGEPARKLGLKYHRYAILPSESSLHREYEKDDPVLRDPESVNARGWEVTKRVYLDGQKVRLDLERFGKRLVKAHRYVSGVKKSRRILRPER